MGEATLGFGKGAGISLRDIGLKETPKPMSELASIGAVKDCCESTLSLGRWRWTPWRGVGTEDIVDRVKRFFVVCWERREKDGSGLSDSKREPASIFKHDRPDYATTRGGQMWMAVGQCR